MLAHPVSAHAYIYILWFRLVYFLFVLSYYIVTDFPISVYLLSLV